jgi:hypothetical protein
MGITFIATNSSCLFIGYVYVICVIMSKTTATWSTHVYGKNLFCHWMVCPVLTMQSQIEHVLWGSTEIQNYKGQLVLALVLGNNVFSHVIVQYPLHSIVILVPFIYPPHCFCWVLNPFTLYVSILLSRPHFGMPIVLLLKLSNCTSVSFVDRETRIYK